MNKLETVRCFRRLRALVIGDAMLDSYLEGSATRLCSEGPVPVVTKETEEHLPGGAANAAANLRSLGADVSFIGLIGNDAAGDLLRQRLLRHGVDDGLLVADELVTTLHKQRILSNDQYVVRFDAGYLHDCSARGRESLKSNIENAFQTCDLVVVSDYCHGTVSSELIETLRALRDSRDIVLLVDSKNLLRFKSARATVVTPNHLEARSAVEPAGDNEFRADPGDLETVGRRLLAVLDSQYIVITKAQSGVLVLEREGESTNLRAHEVSHPYDVGAGDSFSAAMALSLAAGASVVGAAQIGIDAAGIAVGQRRTAVVNHQQLLQRVSLHDDSQVRALAHQELSELLDEERRCSKTVVFTNGVFDILHAGHVHFLREAKKLGDVLVVAVNSDRGARRVKGRNRPINGERDRLGLVGALESVDHAILFDAETPADLIRLLRPDIHAKGGDYDASDLPEAEAVRETGGRVVIVPLISAEPKRPYSTTNLIDRIVEISLEELEAEEDSHALEVHR